MQQKRPGVLRDGVHRERKTRGKKEREKKFVAEKVNNSASSGKALNFFRPSLLAV
jgi:hypothetical protein